MSNTGTINFAELAVAAIVDGNPPDVVLNREIVEAYGLDEAAIALLVKRERPELGRRRAVYSGEVRAVRSPARLRSWSMTARRRGRL